MLKIVNFVTSYEFNKVTAGTDNVLQDRSAHKTRRAPNVLVKE